MHIHNWNNLKKEKICDVIKEDQRLRKLKYINTKIKNAVETLGNLQKE